ncbi:hypothetical protein Tco_0233061 [Tanacetum coccineum]
MLWGVVKGTNVDYAELIWEEFVQAIKTFFSDAASLKVPSKKLKPHQMTIHSVVSELDEVFGMAIPKDLLTDAIRNAEYYQKYLEIATRKPRQLTTTTDEESVKKKKVPPTDKSKKPSPAKQTKLRTGRLVDEKDKEPQPASEPPVEDDEYNLQRGIQMSLESFQPLIGGVVIREPASGVTRSLPTRTSIKNVNVGEVKEDLNIGGDC